MKTHRIPTRVRHVVLSALMLVMVGVVSPPGVSAGDLVAFPPPTIGDIVVDSYDCDTGELDFHAPVTNLIAVDPNTTSIVDYPLVYAFGSHHGSEDAPQVFSGLFAWTPTEAQSPFTGIVHLEGVAPPTHDGETITRIVLQILVGTGDTLENPTDFDVTSYLTLTDCSTPDDDLVQQLVALLIQILQDLLNA